MRMRETLAQLAAGRAAGVPSRPRAGRLIDAPEAARNPGALGARMYVPDDLPPGAPLVVVLHGCTQTADGYDLGTGWSRLAERAGFALLFPEQRRANNPNLCFDWFQPVDIARHGGEAESIAAMTLAMVDRHALDPARVYITGLSAGGAMTAAMLATWPELFAGGAIIGGLPYGVANNVGEALAAMAGRGGRPAVVPATGGRRPTVSIWHGTADPTVVVGNLDALARQWRAAHGVASAEPAVEHGAGWERQAWTVEGRTLVETWRIAGMAHGVPIGPAGPDRLGAAGPYMLDSTIDSTTAIAESWGLIGRSVPAGKPAPKAVPAAAQRPAATGSNVQTVIEDALRAAGLMR